VWLASLCNHRADPALPQQSAVLVVVVATVGQQRVRPAARSSDSARDGRNLVEQRQELGDVVAVCGGQRHRERDAPPVDDEVVFAARSCAVDRAGTAFGPLRAARTCEESITARDQSSLPPACVGSDGARYNLETDMRAIQGTYIAADGSRRHGTFGFI
jgi:hypothetical protein